MAQNDWREAVRDAILAWEGPAFLVVSKERERDATDLCSMGGQREFTDQREKRTTINMESRVLVWVSDTLTGDAWSLVPRAWDAPSWGEGPWIKRYDEAEG